MGNLNSQQIEQQQWYDDQQHDITQQATFIKKMEDPRFGEISIYQWNKTLNLFMSRNRQLTNQRLSLSQFNKMSANMFSLKHENLLQMLGYEFQFRSDLCGTTNKFCIYYEYINHNLDFQITRRHKRAEYFSESELWYLLESIVSVNVLFTERGVYHSDIRPINVLLGKNGIAQLADQTTMNPGQTGYLQTLLSNDGSDYSYISPQLMEELSQKNQDPVHNKYKSDVWSLGLTLLEAATLISSRTVYDWDELSISYASVKELLARIQSRYSTPFVNLVSIMLQPIEQNRPDFLEIEDLKRRNPSRVASSQNLFIVQHPAPAGTHDRANSNYSFSTPDRSSASKSQNQIEFSQQSGQSSGTTPFYVGKPTMSNRHSPISYQQGSEKRYRYAQQSPYVGEGDKSFLTIKQQVRMSTAPTQQFAVGGVPTISSRSNVLRDSSNTLTNPNLFIPIQGDSSSIMGGNKLVMTSQQSFKRFEPIKDEFNASTKPPTHPPAVFTSSVVYQGSPQKIVRNRGINENFVVRNSTQNFQASIVEIPNQNHAVQQIINQSVQNYSREESPNMQDPPISMKSFHETDHSIAQLQDQINRVLEISDETINGSTRFKKNNQNLKASSSTTGNWNSGQFSGNQQNGQSAVTSAQFKNNKMGQNF